MIEINLLPKELQWRRFSFKLDKKLVILLVSGLVVIFALAVYSFIFQAGQISRFNDNIARYRAETDQYEAEIRKIDEINEAKVQITARMTAIEILNRNRGYWVELMEDLIRRIPEYLWLTSVQDASSIAAAASRTPGTAPVAARSTMEGFSFSLNALATFLVRLKKSDVFQNIEISSINLEESEQTKAYFFKLTCDFNAPETAAPTESAQATAAPGGQF